jgi:hypothetical protein
LYKPVEDGGTLSMTVRSFLKVKRIGEAKEPGFFAKNQYGRPFVQLQS